MAMAVRWISLAPVLFLAIAVLCSLEETVARKSKTKIIIAAIIPRDRNSMFAIDKVKPAVSVSLLRARSLGLLKCCEIDVKYSDSKCNGKDAPIEAFDLYMKNGREHPMLFLGPVCDYALAPVARYSPYWNVPVISPGGFAHDFGVDKSLPDAEFPTLTRVGATFDKLTEAMISIIKYYQWRKIKVIYDPTAHSDISPKFCFLATGAIIHYLKNDTDVRQDFHLINGLNFDPDHILRKEVGTGYSGLGDPGSSLGRVRPKTLTEGAAAASLGVQQ